MREVDQWFTTALLFLLINAALQVPTALLLDALGASGSLIGIAGFLMFYVSVFVTYWVDKRGKENFAEQVRAREEDERLQREKYYEIQRREKEIDRIRDEVLGQDEPQPCVLETDDGFRYLSPLKLDNEYGIKVMINKEAGLRQVRVKVAQKVERQGLVEKWSYGKVLDTRSINDIEGWHETVMRNYRQLKEEITVLNEEECRIMALLARSVWGLLNRQERRRVEEVESSISKLEEFEDQYRVDSDWLPDGCEEYNYRRFVLIGPDCLIGQTAEGGNKAVSAIFAGIEHVTLLDVGDYFDERYEQRDVMAL